ITAEMNRLMADPGAIDAVLRRGAERAGGMAKRHLAEIYDIVGFLRP
ncbi:MAG: tryptophan--tRNA ligase, partial [Azospirillum sp.]|nr:tryptophan--tRNA ligase [Azospirillum sp.]